MTQPRFAPLRARLLQTIDPRLSWAGYLLAAGTALALAIALLDPLVTSGLSLPIRALFWLANVAAALTLLELTQIAIGRTPFARSLSPLVQVLLAGLIGAILFAGLTLITLDQLLPTQRFDKTPDVLSLLGLLHEVRDSAGETILFWLVLNSPRLIMIAQQADEDTASDAALAEESAPSSQSPTADPALVELLRRMPRRLGTDIVGLTAELHYLRVHTRLGEALILMSFGRAVQALEAIPGMAVHRSHWVALGHIATLTSEGDQVYCLMDTGQSFPVSRRTRSRLRKALRERDQRAAELVAHKCTAPPQPTARAGTYAS